MKILLQKNSSIIEFLYLKTLIEKRNNIIDKKEKENFKILGGLIGTDVNSLKLTNEISKADIIVGDIGKGFYNKIWILPLYYKEFKIKKLNSLVSVNRTVTRFNVNKDTFFDINEPEKILVDLYPYDKKNKFKFNDFMLMDCEISSPISPLSIDEFNIYKKDNIYYMQKPSNFLGIKKNSCPTQVSMILQQVKV